MDNMTTFTAFFGWCSVLNIGMLLFATLFLAFFRSFAKDLHSKLFNVSEEQLDLIYFKYLAYYKLTILVINLAPYFALKIMMTG